MSQMQRMNQDEKGSHCGGMHAMNMRNEWLPGEEINCERLKRLGMLAASDEFVAVRAL